MYKPVIAIVGRPNVGKSTFFNRVLGSRTAIVDEFAGSTRDRIYRDGDWAGHDFLLIDTGGLVADPDEPLASEIAEQVRLACDEADVIVFIVDGKAGLTGQDQDIANQLRRVKKPILLAVNKIDDPKQTVNTSEFFQLGLGEPMALSAMRGTGDVGDLLDKIVSFFPKKAKQKIEEEEIETNHEEAEKELKAFSIAIVGKPNVGKSSIVNFLCGSQRCIVTPEAGTTRDAIDTTIRYKGKDITLIDTAGIRRKSKVSYGVEAFSVVRSLSALSRADVVAMVLDANEGVSDQDQKIARKIEEAGKPCVVVLNKWDLIENRSSSSMKEFQEELDRELPHLRFAETVFSSAQTKQRVAKIMEAAERALLEGRRRISTSLVNQVINEAVALVPPPASKRGKRLRIYYSSQVSTLPPTFVLFANDAKLLTSSYRTYLERKIREAFGFKGTPIIVALRSKER